LFQVKKTFIFKNLNKKLSANFQTILMTWFTRLSSVSHNWRHVE